MDRLSDEALLAGLASGDPDDAAAFVRRFQRRVYGLACTILHDDDLADDAAQEAFLRAWRHAVGYDPRRGRVAAWLLTIARNVAIDPRADAARDAGRRRRDRLAPRALGRRHARPRRARARASGARRAPRRTAAGARARRVRRPDRPRDLGARRRAARHREDPHPDRDAHPPRDPGSRP